MNPYFDRGVWFVHDGRQYVTENEPVYKDSSVPYFRAFCVELPDVDRLVSGELCCVYYAEFVIKTDVLESDKFEWSDVLCEYKRLCDKSELDFCRDAYLEEPVIVKPSGVVITIEQLMEHLRI